MKKTLLATLLCGIAFYMLAACGSSYTDAATNTSYAATEHTDPFRELTCVSSGGMEKKVVYDYTDPETGVHYLIYSEHQYSSGMGGITPRLNPDGSTMVEEKKQ